MEQPREALQQQGPLGGPQSCVPEAEKVFDRQIRIWGFEAQKKSGKYLIKPHACMHACMHEAIVILYGNACIYQYIQIYVLSINKYKYKYLLSYL